MNIDESIIPSKGITGMCEICNRPTSGQPVVAARGRIGTKLIGKDFRKEACIPCAERIAERIASSVKRARNGEVLA